jgi:hypothetical protein
MMPARRSTGSIRCRCQPPPAASPPRARLVRDEISDEEIPQPPRAKLGKGPSGMAETVLAKVDTVMAIVCWGDA